MELEFFSIFCSHSILLPQLSIKFLHNTSTFGLNDCVKDISKKQYIRYILLYHLRIMVVFCVFHVLLFPHHNPIR